MEVKIVVDQDEEEDDEGEENDTEMKLEGIEEMKP